MTNVTKRVDSRYMSVYNHFALYHRNNKYQNRCKNCDGKYNYLHKNTPILFKMSAVIVYLFNSTSLIPGLSILPKSKSLQITLIMLSEKVIPRSPREPYSGTCPRRITSQPYIPFLVIQLDP
jgi:hypothetical protein